jgi:hypothetical protein
MLHSLDFRSGGEVLSLQELHALVPQRVSA